MNTHTHIHTNTHVLTHTHIHTNTTCTHRHVHTHTYTNTTCAHTHTHRRCFFPSLEKQLHGNDSLTSITMATLCSSLPTFSAPARLLVFGICFQISLHIFCLSLPLTPPLSSSLPFSHSPPLSLPLSSSPSHTLSPIGDLEGSENGPSSGLSLLKGKYCNLNTIKV